MKKYQIISFFRIYWWNVQIVKEKELPIFSTLLGIAVLHILNFTTIVFGFITFVIEDVNIYPKWIHIICMLLILIIDYFLFVHKDKYKEIISKNHIPENQIKKLDYLVIFYILLTFVSLAFIIIKGRELLT